MVTNVSNEIDWARVTLGDLWDEVQRGHVANGDVFVFFRYEGWMTEMRDAILQDLGSDQAEISRWYMY